MRSLCAGALLVGCFALFGCSGADAHHHHDGHDPHQGDGHHNPHGDGHHGDAHHGDHHDGHGHANLPFGHGHRTVGHGHAVDGMVLRSVRHAAHHGFHRMVFDVSRPHSEAEVVPHATASYHAHDHSIELRISGVHRDVTGHELRKPVAVDRPPVAHFTRQAHSDHHMAAYRVQLTRGARFRLHALTSPVRIVLDVEKIDLEK